MRPNAAIIGDSENATRMTRSMMDQKNPTGILLNNAFLNRRPNYFVYIYNASDIQHVIPRPWAHPNVIIPPCEAGEAYSRPFIIPDILAEVIPQAGRHGLAVNGVDGKFLAQDAIMPESPNGSWETYQRVAAGNAMSGGTDLYQLGCWWSLNPEPEVDSREVTLAHARLGAFYEEQIGKATALSLEGPKGVAMITPLMHRACDHFKLTTEWHKRFTARVECPGCGETVPAGIVRHMPKDKCGFVFNWLGAIKQGMATKAEAKESGVSLAGEPLEEVPEIAAAKAATKKGAKVKK